MDTHTPEASFIGIIAKPSYVKALQTVGVTSAAFVAGQTAVATYGFLPAILDAPPALLARQWRKAQEAMVLPSTCCTVAGAVIFAFMAYREPSARTSSFRLFALASLLIPSVHIYDMFVIDPLAKEFASREEYQSPAESWATYTVQGNRRTTVVEFTKSVMPGQRPYIQDLNTHQLADRWGWLNLGRAALLTCGALLGAFAIADEDLSFFELLS